MSISTYQPRADYIGTGVLDTYSFDFTITDKSQLLIVKIDDTGALVWAVDGEDLTYLSSVTFNDDGGGQVVLAVDLPVDYKLAIILNANEPTQPQQFARRSSWTLQQFEDAFDYLCLQLQAVAYLAKRAPVLGKFVTANQADAFDTEIELLADSVIAVNALGTGFEAVSRSEFVGEVGATGTASPLTTKGDLYTFSTVNARLAVGTNNQALVADSTQATGLKWLSIVNSITSSLDLAASGTIAIVTTSIKQTWLVQGASAAVTLSPTPFGATPPPDGAEIWLIGNSDTNTVEIPANDAANGCLMDGTVILAKGQTAKFMYSTTLARYVRL